MRVEVVLGEAVHLVDLPPPSEREAAEEPRVRLLEVRVRVKVRVWVRFRVRFRVRVRVRVRFRVRVRVRVIEKETEE